MDLTGDEQALRRMRQVGRALRLVARIDVGPPATTDPGPVIHAANHRSLADLVFAAAAFAQWGQPIRCLAAASYFARPGIGRLLRDLRCIPVEGMASLDIAKEVLAGGTPVAIMPEGRLVGPEEWDDTGVGRPHPGVGRLAIDTGLPVAVAGAAGTEELWPMGRARPLVRPWDRTLLAMRTLLLGPVEAVSSRDAAAVIWEGVRRCVAEAEAARA